MAYIVWPYSRKPVLLRTRARRDPRSSLGVPAETRPFPSCNPLLSVRSSSNLMHVAVRHLWRAPVSSSASVNLVSSWLVSFFLSPLLSFFFSPIIGTLAGRNEPRQRGRTTENIEQTSRSPTDILHVHVRFFPILSACPTRTDQASQPYFNRSTGYRVADCLLLGTLLTRHWHACR